LTTKKHLIYALVCSGFLSGCFENKKSISTICEQTPGICLDIKTNGWCLDERSILIRNRHQQIINPKDEGNLYNSLINWKKFSHCIEAASNIKRRNIDDRNPTKATSFVNSITEIEKLEQLTKNSAYPQLLYYHWTQDGDENKILKLQELDKKGKLNTTQLQLMMASFYRKTNQKKAIDSQYKALTFLTHSDLEQLDHTIFASLSTYNFQIKEFEQSYIWAQIAIKFGLKASLYSSLYSKLERQGISLTDLDLEVEKIYISINNLTFSYPE